MSTKDMQNLLRKWSRSPCPQNDQVRLTTGVSSTAYNRGRLARRVRGSVVISQESVDDMRVQFPHLCRNKSARVSLTDDELREVHKRVSSRRHLVRAELVSAHSDLQVVTQELRSLLDLRKRQAS